MVRSATRPNNPRGAGNCWVALRLTQPTFWTLVLALLFAPSPTLADTRAAAAALIAAYPDFLERVEEGTLVWKDGTRMPLDDGKGAKSLERKLADPDIEDMFSMPYPVGETGVPPPADFDPGRVRFGPLFDKMYGNCLAGSIQKALVPVVWLPTKAAARLMFNSVNGAAEQLRKVSEELDKLPPRFLEFLHPSAGTYNCRPIVEAGQALLVDDTYQLDDTFTLTPTPGHSPRHCCVNIASKGQRAVVTGVPLRRALREKFAGARSAARRASCSLIGISWVQSQSRRRIRIPLFETNGPAWPRPSAISATSCRTRKA